ncbi:hypothetical protein [Roseovarius salinarum]|uniref:hypothetical protein n=1 Tax=Roseovarius salinarum TaxID=1981892 RepID=UPI000C31E16E|nr:hypothetical protein [Roseovarius salinarum]
MDEAEITVTRIAGPTDTLKLTQQGSVLATVRVDASGAAEMHDAGGRRIGSFDNAEDAVAFLRRDRQVDGSVLD